MSEATQTQTLEQTFNKTDLGHLIYEYRKLMFALIGAVLVGVMAYALWKQSQKSQAEAVSAKVFEFQSKTWASVKEGKLAATELPKIFEALDQEVKNAPVMIPLALEMGKYLFDKGQFVEADMILSKLNSNQPIAQYFIATQRAVILEKLNKIPEAILALEQAAKNKDALMAAKLNLELGRLNFLNGEKGKAQTHFEYVLSTFPNDDLAKLAKLYMGKMNK
jgi:tetratricopeptide (TPR) repeat protein